MELLVEEESLHVVKGLAATIRKALVLAQDDNIFGDISEL